METRFTNRAAALATVLTLAASTTHASDHGRDRDRPTPPPTPTTLAVPAGHRAFLMAHALGTQNYMCLPGTSGLAWTPVGPQATLFDDEGGQVTTHFLSPNPDEKGVARATWQHSRDTSAAWALSIASSADPAYVQSGAIPWLLLRVVGADPGTGEHGKLAKTTYLQRVNTVGGMAPAAPCTEIGTRAFVFYEADYVFYRAKGQEND